MNTEQINQALTTLFKKQQIPKEKEKGELGEVFTPIKLVEKMLTLLPEHIWEQKDMRWLDPTCGEGNFMIAVYQKLMITLSNHPTLNDKAVRSKHIIEHMLYMVEYNPTSVQTIRNIFLMLDPNATPNIQTGDFLTTCHLLEKDETKPLDHRVVKLLEKVPIKSVVLELLEKVPTKPLDRRVVKLLEKVPIKSVVRGRNREAEPYDIIVMNPPYNLGGTKCRGQKNVWVFFAQHALSLLKKGGYYLAIHPAAYRLNNYKPRGTRQDINKLYTSYDICNIIMYTIWQTYELMHVQINVDVILIHKTQTNCLTKIEDIFGKTTTINIQHHPTIANFGFSILNKLKIYTEQYGSLLEKIYHTSEMHHDAWKKGKLKEGQHKIIHLIKKKGPKIFMSDKAHTHQSTPKIIINGLGVKYVLLDKNGEYGVTDSPYIILSQSENIYQMLKYKIFNYVVNALGILGNNLKPVVFSYLPDISQINELTEQKLYILLGLTANEIKEVNTFTNKNIQNLKLKGRRGASL